MYYPSKPNNNTNTSTNNIVFPVSQYQQPIQHPQSQSQLNYTVCQNNEYAPLINLQNQQQQQQALRFQMFNHQNMSHSKSYSLPANFQETNQFMMTPSLNNITKMQPPPRSVHGDIPLPSGWELEKTSNGQAYYINHTTKTTSWEDPRKLLNLPKNQIDINSDTRAIINAIPLPNGWEEARTGNNEVYYINHLTKTTTWEDPRVAIYMQQQQQKQLNECKFSFINNQIDTNRMINSSSTSSICSTASSSSFTSSSSSLNGAMNSTLIDIDKNSKKEGLKKNLDDLIAHKNSIIKQIDDLTLQEMNIKSKLSQQDIEHVLKILNTSSTQNQLSTKNMNQHFNKENMIINSINYEQSFEHVNNLSNTSINSDNNDMDTTLVTEN